MPVTDLGPRLTPDGQDRSDSLPNCLLQTGHPMPHQARHWQHHEGTRLATAKDASVDQCVCTEQDDESCIADVGKKLKRVGKRESLSQFPIYSTPKYGLKLPPPPRTPKAPLGDEIRGAAGKRLSPNAGVWRARDEGASLPVLKNAIDCCSCSA